jgi:hypothetical protein
MSTVISINVSDEGYVHVRAHHGNAAQTPCIPQLSAIEEVWELRGFQAKHGYLPELKAVSHPIRNWEKISLISKFTLEV